VTQLVVMKKPEPYSAPAIVGFFSVIGILSVIIGAFCIFASIASSAVLFVPGIVAVINGLVVIGISGLADTVYRTHWNTKYIAAQLVELQEQLGKISLPSVVHPEPVKPRIQSMAEPINLDDAIHEQAMAKRVRERAPQNMIMEGKNKQRLREMRAAGITEIRVTTEGDGCPVCRTFLNRIMPISVAPQVPPPGCTCEPYCLCVIGPAG